MARRIAAAGGGRNLGILNYESNFTSGTDGFGGFNASAAGNIDGIGGQDDCLRFTSSGGAGVHSVRRSYNHGGGPGNVTFDFYIPSANALIDGVQFSDFGTEGTSFTGYPLDVWHSVSAAIVTWSFFISFRSMVGAGVSHSADGDVFYIKNVKTYIP